MSKWRPHTTGILIVGLVLILVALVASYVVQNFHAPTTQVTIGSGVFHARLADTDLTREKGLSGVEKMAPNDALLMVYDTENTWGIWMKDMKIPLDIVWLDAEKKVVYIVMNASPDLGTSKTFTPTNPAKYVLEVPSGAVKTSGIKVGDTASFTIEGAK